MPERLNADQVKWIVNDLGELGVEINGQCFFCYKGESLEYAEPIHDDGGEILYRGIGKREFGEVVNPPNYYSAGWNLKRRYAQPIETPHRIMGPQSDDWHYSWRPVPPIPESAAQ